MANSIHTFINHYSLIHYDRPNDSYQFLQREESMNMRIDTTEEYKVWTRAVYHLDLFDTDTNTNTLIMILILNDTDTNTFTTKCQHIL